MSGRRQAIRLAARFRLNTRKVTIQPVGNGLGAWLKRFYAEHEPLPDSFLSDRGDGAPQHRDWD